MAEQNQPALPGFEGPDPSVANFDPSKIRPLAPDYEKDEAERREAIAERRGEDLAAEQTGFKPDIVAKATGTSEPPRMRAPKSRHPSRRGGRSYPEQSGRDRTLEYDMAATQEARDAAAGEEKTDEPNRPAEAVIASAGIIRAKSMSPDNVHGQLAIEQAARQKSGR